MNEGVDTSKWPSAKEIRDWANSRQPGVIKDRGNLPRFLILAWDRAHPDRKYAPSQSYHGTQAGYATRGCRCGRCLEAGRAYHRDVYYLNRDERDDHLADDLLGDSA